MYNVIMWSGGKDSTATVILAHEKGIQIDDIIYCEVMFSDTISAEYPEHLEFINECIFTFEKWGYPVTIVRSGNTFVSEFNRIYKRSKDPEKNGKKYGFPLTGHCHILSHCKKPVLEWAAKTADNVYLGIAADEPERLARLKAPQASLLARYNMTEKDARKLCKGYGLLSPVYDFSGRGGCWFCPNASVSELRYLYNNHPQLWRNLAGMEGDPEAVRPLWGTKGRTLKYFEKRFKNEIDRGNKTGNSPLYGKARDRECRRHERTSGDAVPAK